MPAYKSQIYLLSFLCYLLVCLLVDKGSYTVSTGVWRPGHLCQKYPNHGWYLQEEVWNKCKYCGVSGGRALPHFHLQLYAYHKTAVFAKLTGHAGLIPWSLNSPDLTLLDFSIREFVKGLACIPLIPAALCDQQQCSIHNMTSLSSTIETESWRLKTAKSSSCLILSLCFALSSHPKVVDSHFWSFYRTALVYCPCYILVSRASMPDYFHELGVNNSLPVSNAGYLKI